jgi:hypothetical protein
MGWRTKSPQRSRLKFDPLDESIKRKIEVQTRLFAVRDYIQSGIHLVVNRCDDCIVLQLFPVGFTEVFKMLASEFKPAGKRVAANYRGAKRLLVHSTPCVLLA